MFVNITEKPPWGSVIKAITITIAINLIPGYYAYIVQVELIGIIAK